MLPGRPSRGEQIEVRVECVGRVDEPVGGVLAEAFDPLSDVRRERSDGGWGDLPALGGELAQDRGHVQGGVEDHAVREQRVELDDLLLLGGVVALDRVVPEPQPGGELVVGLDLVRRGGDLLAQLGLGDVPQQRDRADHAAELAERLVDVVLARLGPEPAQQQRRGQAACADREDDLHQVDPVRLDQRPVDRVLPGGAEQLVDVRVADVR